MGESIRHALWVIVQFVVVAIALLLFLGVVVAYGMKISIWPIIAMMAIVVYRLLPKPAGVFGIAIAVNSFISLFYIFRETHFPLPYSPAKIMLFSKRTKINSIFLFYLMVIYIVIFSASLAEIFLSQ